MQRCLEPRSGPIGRISLKLISCDLRSSKTPPPIVAALVLRESHANGRLVAATLVAAVDAPQQPAYQLEIMRSRIVWTPF